METGDLYLNFGKDLHRLEAEKIEFSTDIDPDRIISGSSVSFIGQSIGVLQSGKLTFSNDETGYILGVDEGTPKFYIGTPTNYLNFDGSTVTIYPSLSVGSLHIPDETTEDSFHVDSDGNTWWGAVAIGDAVAKVLKTGIATFTDIIITGGTVNWSTVVGTTNAPDNNATVGATIGSDVLDEDANTPVQDLVVNWKKLTAGEAITKGRAVGFGEYNAAKTYLDTALWIDAYVDIDDADANFGTSENVKIGTSNDRGITDGKRYYMRIDTDDLPESITEVLLKLWKLSIVNAIAINFTISRVTQNWTENNITWNNKPDDDNVVWVSGEFRDTAEFTEIDIISLILYWKSIIETNYGLVIKCSGYGGGSAGSVTYLNTHSIEKEGGPEAQLSVEGLEDVNKIYLTDITQAHSVYNFIGFAKENISQDAEGGVQLLNVVSGLSSLKTNVTYFLGNSVGGITVNPAHASGVVLKIGRALSSTTLLMKEGQRTARGSFNANNSRYEIIKTGFRPIKIEFKVKHDTYTGWGIAWARNKQQYAVASTTGSGTYNGSDAVYYEGSGAKVKVEIIAIYNAATLLKITYGGSAQAKIINWVAVG